MKKKKLHILIGVISVLIIVIVLLFFVPTPNIIFSQSATAGQIYNDKNINCQLSDEDAKKCVDMFAGKWCFIDNPSCEFEDDTFVQIGINKFQPACDGCAIVKNGNKYFTLSETERATLDEILNKYDITFPCV